MEILKGTVERNISNTPEGWLEAGKKIASLPFTKQCQVVAAGMSAGYDQYLHEENERHWGALIGEVQGLGNVATNLATIADFSAYCIIGDDKRAGELGAQYGNALGETIVGGIETFRAANQYLFMVGYKGDYAKPLKDVAAIGDALNKEWGKLPPKEQERRKGELISQMVAEGVVGNLGISAVNKAKKFTDILDAVAEQAAKHAAPHIDAAAKAAKEIAQTIKQLGQPEFVTSEGLKVKIPLDGQKIDDHILKMVGRRGVHIPAARSFFLKASEHGPVALKADEIEALGGAAKLEGMTEAELTNHGLKKYELPKLNLSSDTISAQVQIHGHNRSWFRLMEDPSGKLILTDIMRGELPKGLGAHFLAECLKAHGIKPIGKLILEPVIEKNTLEQLSRGVPIEDTMIAKMMIKSLKELGITPKAFHAQYGQGKHLKVIIDLPEQK
jgi:hypothetical protein